jgi:hypothetical protein
MEFHFISELRWNSQSPLETCGSGSGNSTAQCAPGGPEQTEVLKGLYDYPNLQRLRTTICALRAVFRLSMVVLLTRRAKTCPLFIEITKKKRRVVCELNTRHVPTHDVGTCRTSLLTHALGGSVVPVPPCVQARERPKSEHAENGRWRMRSGPLPEFVHAVHLTPGTLLFRG